MTWPLPESISPGDAGETTHAEEVHTFLNTFDHDTAPAVGDAWVWDGSSWVPDSTTYAGVGKAVGLRGTTSAQYLAPAGIIDGTTFATANEVIYAVPLYVPEALTLDRIGCKINTAGQAGSLVRLGIYNADADSAKPSSLLVDGGTVAGDSTGTKEVTISEAVDPGLLWLAAATQSAPSTRPALASFRPIGFPFTYNTLANSFSENVYSQTGVSGAFNASFGTTFYNAKGPAIVVRVA